MFRMTLGDAALQREVLELFDRQIVLLTDRMHTAPPAAVATLAHTLKGSARGIGAWALVSAAEAVESAVAQGDDPAEPLHRLALAGHAVRAAIATLRRAAAS
ncbi:putative Hpt domain protein [Rhodovulum sp. PH10]|nr:putative Hpt domain protein [Rhodovulum sp. PH10]